MRLAHAGDFGFVFFRLGQEDGIAFFDQHRSGGFEHVGDSNRRGSGVDPDCFSRCAEFFEFAAKSVRISERCQFAEPGLFAGCELGFGDKQRRFAACRHDGEAEYERRVGHVPAANVEQPADGFGQGEHNSAGLRLAQGGPQLIEFVLGFFAGAVGTEDFGLCIGRAGPVSPNGIDQVRAGDEFCALAKRFTEGMDISRRMQPGVIADAFGLARLGGDGGGEARWANRVAGDDFSVRLGRRLQGVAPVNKQVRGFVTDIGEARRAREAGQPGQACFARRYRFAAMHVGPGHQIAVDLAGLHCLAQVLDTACHSGGVSALFKALIDGSRNAVHRPQAKVSVCPGSELPSRS